MHSINALDTLFCMNLGAAARIITITLEVHNIVFALSPATGYLLVASAATNGTKYWKNEKFVLFLLNNNLLFYHM